MMNSKFSKSLIFRSLFYCCLCTVLTACPPTTTPTPIPSPSPISGTDEAIAVVDYVDGDVTFLDSGNKSTVKIFQELKDGSTLELTAGAKVTIICFQERFLVIDQPGEIQITKQQCANGIPLPANTTQYVKPDAGRIISTNGSLALEEQSRERETDYGNIPIILTPRNTALLDLQPMITWVEVSGSIEYQLSLSGLDSFDDVILSTEAISCVEDTRISPDRICSTSWPTMWLLEAGKRYFLTVSARTGIAAPLRISETSSLRTLTRDEAESIQTSISSLNTLKLDTVTNNLLLGGIYHEHDLLGDSIAAYEDAAALQPSPTLSVTLGDIYLRIGLQRFAFFAYESGLKMLDSAEQTDPEVRAAIEYGIGLVYFTRQNYIEAKKHFAISVALYEEMGNYEELRNAQIALEESAKRQP